MTTEAMWCPCKACGELVRAQDVAVETKISTRHWVSREYLCLACVNGKRKKRRTK